MKVSVNGAAGEMFATLCEVCHAKAEQQDGKLLWPANGRGNKAKLDRLENPESRQTKLDEFNDSSNDDNTNEND